MMKKVLAMCAVIAALAIFAGSAQAQWGCGYGGYGGGYGYSSYGHGGYNYGFIGQPHYHWHDTSHWDYHPTRIIPHGNHFHVQPGHYHWHNQGHWDAHW